MSEHASIKRIGVCSWSLQPTGPQDLLAELDAVELDAVQVALSPVVNDPETWGDVVPTLEASRIDVLSGMMAMEGEDYTSLASIARTGGVRSDETWLRNREHAVRVAELASRWNIGLVTFHAGFIPEDASDPEHQSLIERLRIIADEFGARGVLLGLETGQETAETLESMLDALDRPNVGVNFDPANMILYGRGEPVAALRRLAPWVLQIHLKDALPADQPGQWGTEVPVGEGAVDWSAFLAIANALQREVNLLIEREQGDQRIADIRLADQFVRSGLSRATAR